MGTAKALLPMDGVPLLLRTVEVLRRVPRITRIVVVGQGPWPPLPGDVQSLSDRVPHLGPCGGIQTAFQHDPSVTWLVVACDHPLLDTDALDWLIDQRRPSVSAVIPLRPEADAGAVNRPTSTPALQSSRAEPLLAIYEPAMLVALNALGRASGSLRKLADCPGVCTPEIPEHLLTSWINVNTPEEFEQAVQRAARRKA